MQPYNFYISLNPITITPEAPSFQLLSSQQRHQGTGESFMFSKRTLTTKIALRGYLQNYSGGKDECILLLSNILYCCHLSSAILHLVSMVPLISPAGLQPPFLSAWQDSCSQTEWH